MSFRMANKPILRLFLYVIQENLRLWYDKADTACALLRLLLYVIQENLRQSQC